MDYTKLFEQIYHESVLSDEAELEKNGISVSELYSALNRLTGYISQCEEEEKHVYEMGYKNKIKQWKLSAGKKHDELEIIKNDATKEFDKVYQQAIKKGLTKNGCIEDMANRTENLRLRAENWQVKFANIDNSIHDYSEGPYNPYAVEPDGHIMEESERIFTKIYNATH